jgi:hypothetical protein
MMTLRTLLPHYSLGSLDVLVERNLAAKNQPKPPVSSEQDKLNAYRLIGSAAIDFISSASAPPGLLQVKSPELCGF